MSLLGNYEGLSFPFSVKMRFLSVSFLLLLAGGTWCDDEVADLDGAESQSYGYGYGTKVQDKYSVATGKKSFDKPSQNEV